MLKDNLIKIIRHIRDVQNNALLLSEKLIEQGELLLSKDLVANSLIHDNSKFYDIEWKYLNEETKISHPDLFEKALSQHVKTNKHHPEYWGHINYMPRLYIAELTCDIVARSQECGSSVQEWLNKIGIIKYHITTKSNKYKEICEFLSLLLNKTFL